MCLQYDKAMTEEFRAANADKETIPVYKCLRKSDGILIAPVFRNTRYEAGRHVAREGDSEVPVGLRDFEESEVNYGIHVMVTREGAIDVLNDGEVIVEFAAKVSHLRAVGPYGAEPCAVFTEVELSPENFKAAMEAKSYVEPYEDSDDFNDDDDDWEDDDDYDDDCDDDVEWDDDDDNDDIDEE